MGVPHATDLGEEDFTARKDVIEQVGRWSEGIKDSEEWVPILYLYEADRFMSLATYLYHDEGKPEWVRGTYVTKSVGYALDPRLLQTFDAPASNIRKISHVTAETFIPSLLGSERDSIDTVLKQSGKRVPKSDVSPRVLGTKETRPDVSAVWGNPRTRANVPNATRSAVQIFCFAAGTSTVYLIAFVTVTILIRCRLIHYCGRECQKLAWPMHKLVCKKEKA
ncbi:hypothetical protein DFH07DRAFT_950831 [Mycena maculata]|uniref:MYND-type domain-containing protein n=1 Tax=Mycena maculata TaxID=230809 RepID=A0AAD7K5H2_9AGAR|nr:hypothetical protein DFH07DRAFT_950831 [Mycena maculata]